MKKIFLICGCLVAAIIILQLFVPFAVNAQSGTQTTGSGSGSQPSGGTSITNPLQSDSIQALIASVLQFVVNLLAIAGVLYIIWTGFLFVKAQGNPKELETAKKSFTNAIIGMAIILGAWGIATVISNTLSKVTNQNVGLSTQSST